MRIDPEALQDLQAMTKAWASEHVRAGNVEEAESLAQEVAWVVGQAVAEAAIAGIAGKRTYQGSSVECSCGRRARFMDYRGRMLVTLCGDVPVSRAYYHCEHCGQGQRPWDAAQGLTEKGWTPRVKALVSATCGRLTYREARELLAETTPIRLSESSAEFIVKEVGTRVRQEEAKQSATCLSGLAPPPEGPPIQRLYVAMDGIMSRIDGGFHEVKAGAVYEAHASPDGVDTSGAKRYVAAHESAEAFSERLYAEAWQAGVERAEEVVVLSDGAAWIRKVAQEHYPQATHIVDYYHATEYIWSVANAQYGEPSAPAKRWAHGHCRTLKKKGPRTLLRALRRLRPANPEAAEARRTAETFFANNASRMQYHRYRARGLMIGSGVAEAACKVVVGQRLKQAGMRWTHDGADHVLAIRCLVLNHDQEAIRRCARAA